MTVRMADAVKNAMLDAYESNIGTSPVLRMYTGSVHATFGTAPAGTLLAELTLPSDWMAAASAGSKAKSGTWQDASANASGTIGCYTLSTSGGTIIEDGSVTATGGGGDIEVDNTSAVAGQAVTITGWTLSI